MIAGFAGAIHRMAGIAWIAAMLVLAAPGISLAQDDEAVREAREAGEAQPALPASEAREAREALPARPTPPPEAYERMEAEPAAPEPLPASLRDRYLDAARTGDLAALKLVLDQGVDPRVKDALGRSALALAVRDARSLEVADFLRRTRDLPLDEPDNAGRTPLHEATANGDPPLVAWLLMHKARPDRKDAQGRTPLHEAVLSGNEETVLLLLTVAADVNARDNLGETPLIAACSKGLDDIAILLVDKGADPALKDQKGSTARDRAPETATFCRGLSDSGPAQ